MLGDGSVVEAKCVVFAMGPWTTLLDEWLGLNTPMVGIKSSSLSFYPDDTKSSSSSSSSSDASPEEDTQVASPQPTVVAPAVLFCNEDSNGCHLEVYPRPDNQVYLCGLSGSPHLTSEEVLAMSADQVKPEMDRVDKGCESFRRMTVPWMANGATLDNVTAQACLRPCTSDSLPMMGKLKLLHGRMGRRRGQSRVVEATAEESNAVGGTPPEMYVAAGHNCWGILWGPVCGQAMAELILDGHSSTLDLGPFDPHRFEWD
jgi:glycine/D-amino acid oxidase-like deaminating enzyme